MAEQAHAPSTGRQAMAGRATGVNTTTDAAAGTPVKRGAAERESDYAAALGRPEVEAKLLAAVWQRKPRVVIKADLLPGVAVLSFVAVFGMGLAWVWSRLAPPMQYVVLSGGQSAELPDESWHRFDDLAIFCLISIGLGILVGSGVWLMREHRGPVVLLAAVIGCGLGSWLAIRSGVSFAQGLYPLGAAPHVGSVVTKAPTLDSGWVIVAQPLGVALAYGVLAAYNGMHDLGRRLG